VVCPATLFHPRHCVWHPLDTHLSLLLLSLSPLYYYYYYYYLLASPCLGQVVRSELHRPTLPLPLLPLFPNPTLPLSQPLSATPPNTHNHPLLSPTSRSSPPHSVPCHRCFSSLSHTQGSLGPPSPPVSSTASPRGWPLFDAAAVGGGIGRDRLMAQQLRPRWLPQRTATLAGCHWWVGTGTLALALVLSNDGGSSNEEAVVAVGWQSGSSSSKGGWR